MDKKQQVELTRAFLSTHGIALNETYLFFTSGRWVYQSYEFDNHLNAMLEVFKFVTQKNESPCVTVMREEKKVVVKIGDSEALVYRKHWFFDHWVCKRSESYKVKFNTVIFGDSVGDMFGMFVNAVLNIRPTQTV